MPKPSALRGLYPVVATLLAVMAFRAFAYDRYTVPSGSMEPTLLVGDNIMVDKKAYGIGAQHVSWAGAGIDGRLLAGRGPTRGEIAVFRKPRTGLVMVKRVVGLPGDRVMLSGGRLFVNGVPAEREAGEGGAFVETLPGGAVHLVAETAGDAGPADDTPEFVVPDGHYFMLGDNRDNSLDSRFMDQVGFVPAANLLGRVDRVIYSGTHCGLPLPCGFREGRTWVTVR